MVAFHPHLFQSSIVDESEICKLVVNHFLPDRDVLQWHTATVEDLLSTWIQPPGLQFLSQTP
jgi:hypothetical protein